MALVEIIARHVEAPAREALNYSPVLIIEGARQVGKSTFASMLAPTATRLSLDVPAIRDAAASDPMGFVSHGGAEPLVIDEVQHAPELMLAIKASVDADRRPGRFILTGSASLLRVRGLSDSLAGRARRLTLYGLSQGELRRRRDDIVTALLDPTRRDALAKFTSKVTRDDYVETVIAGAYPEPRTFPQRVRNAWFDDYLTGVIGRDLSDLRRTVQPDRVHSLLRILATRQSEELVKGRAASDAGIPATSVEGYLDLLRDVHLYQPIPPWTPNLTKRETGRPKVLVNDSGLAARLAGVTASQLRGLLHQEVFGHLLEGFIACELLRQQGWSDTDFRLFHYRDRNGLEVDLVAELDDGRVLAFEVKSASSYLGRQFAGLRALQERLGDRMVAGVVLTTAAEGYRYAPGLWGLPLAALWELSS